MARESIPHAFQDHLAILVAKEILTGATVENFFPVLLDPNGTGALFVANAPIPSPSTFSNGQITVTNVSQLFSAANTMRQYLLIQNNDTVGNIFVSFTAAATLLNGIKIAPGGSFIVDGVAPSNDINIIGDIASNANVVLVTG